MLNHQIGLSESVAKKRARTTQQTWALRVFTYILGLFILALSVSISVRSDLGVSPVSSVPLVFSKVFNIEFGNMTIIEFSAYVVIQVLILRKDFKWIQLLQIACAVIFGKFVTLTSTMIAGWQPGSYIERLGMIALATIGIAVGIKLYLLADIVPQAADGLVQTISRKWGFKLPNVKNIFDICSVAVAASVSLIATGRLVGLREGTVICALGVGRVLALLNKMDGDRLYRLIYATELKPSLALNETICEE
jgi:uncharacterized membrane protein YczE